MTSKQSLPPRDKAKSQTDRFIETARQLGADENEAAFKAKLAVIARQKPKESAAHSGRTTRRKAR